MRAAPVEPPPELVRGLSHKGSKLVAILRTSPQRFGFKEIYAIIEKLEMEPIQNSGRTELSKNQHRNHERGPSSAIRATMKSMRLILLLACLLPIRLVAGEQSAPAASIGQSSQSLKLGVELVPNITVPVPKITVYGPAGAVGQVEWSTSVGNGVISEWHLLKKVTVGTAEATVVDLDVGTLPRFYRAVTGQAPAPPSGFVYIPAGTFVMGSPATEKERSGDEGPQHTVTLTKDFYMSKYEVTQREYLAVMGINPSYFTTTDSTGKPIGPDLNRPVERVSWNDATNYCGKLTLSEKAVGRLPAGWVYRLPTEAEWEYACRAGTSTPFHYGNNLRSGMANFYGLVEYVGGAGTVNNPTGTYLDRTTAVGSYAPNGFGLYDMHGNVWEWCLDWYGAYPGGNVSDPRGSATGSVRVFRGGSWSYIARICRSAIRFNGVPVKGYDFIGFRPVLAPGQ